jgi:hypothetical protein
VASSCEPVSRLAISITSTTARMPTMADEMRQPNGFAPNASMPRPIIHLPNGGCTTYPGPSRKMSVCPALKRAFASAGHEPS